VSTKLNDMNFIAIADLTTLEKSCSSIDIDGGKISGLFSAPVLIPT
jgi:hypothetical protein